MQPKASSKRGSYAHHHGLQGDCLEESPDVSGKGNDKNAASWAACLPFCWAAVMQQTARPPPTAGDKSRTSLAVRTCAAGGDSCLRRGLGVPRCLSDRLFSLHMTRPASTPPSCPTTASRRALRYVIAHVVLTRCCSSRRIGAAVANVRWLGARHVHRRSPSILPLVLAEALARHAVPAWALRPACWATGPVVSCQVALMASSDANGGGRLAWFRADLRYAMRSFPNPGRSERRRPSPATVHSFQGRIGDHQVSKRKRRDLGARLGDGSLLCRHGTFQGWTG